MARRKSSKSLLNDSLFAAILAVVIVLLVVPWIWKIVIGIAALICAALYVYLFRQRMERLRASGMLEIDRMDGEAFEQKLWLVFQDLGYAVQATPYRGDWGADLIVVKDDIRTVVQAKRYSKPVGLKAVQEAVTARAKYNCTHSIVVTNNFFTAQARELAFHNGTELWDRDKLVEMLKRTMGPK
ncbi:MAG: restriction endonuclease [Candidatus Berkelbacteria bacterium]|nr:MAG: restriction endonuclease [Candidatus Berkelbacteria bacterium]QQG51808.1 MAG: restriction endonuclease [Candidatus Berkelbacteria bacterium]